MSLLDKASLIVTPNAYKTSKLYSVVPNTTLGDMDVVRATTATRVNSAGLIENVGVNIPRIDYLNVSCPSILVEPQRTNALTYSEQFNDASWTKSNAIITANSTTAPDGVISADTFTDNSTNAVHVLLKFSQWSTTQKTFTIYVKANTLTKFFISNGSTSAAVCFDLTSGTVEGSITGTGGSVMINPTITPMINGWFRISATHTGTASQALQIGSYKVFNAASLSATATYIGTSQSLYVWGAQLEAGSNATSYIPTVASAITRNADVLTVAPPVGTVQITTTFENLTTEVLTTIPATYTMPEGRVSLVLMQHTL